MRRSLYTLPDFFPASDYEKAFLAGMDVHSRSAEIARRYLVSRRETLAAQASAEATLNFTRAILDADKAERLLAKSGSPKPPRDALFVLRLLYGRDTREALLGDIHEEFAKVVAEQGLRRAQLWVWVEVLRTAMAGVLKPCRLQLVAELLRRLAS